MWSQEKYKLDMEGSISDSERTLDLIRKEASRLVKGLSFTVDCQENNTDRKCPMRDLKVWKEKDQDGQIIKDRECDTLNHMYHSFFNK